MTNPQDKIKLFESQQVRAEWDAEGEKWWFSVVDIVTVLIDQPDYTRSRKYWSVLKTRLKHEGSQLATNCSQLKLTAADGKKYLTDVADTEQILRLIQSIPSKRAEPFKLWLAQVGSDAMKR
jgi:BRO family, N-terminal domain